jgi:hypothetical protein
MHISIGAAILILGVLFLATFPAGRKVLAVVFVLIVVGVGGIGYMLYASNQQTMKENAAYDAKKAAEIAKQSAEQSAEQRAACEKNPTGWRCLSTSVDPHLDSTR